MHIVQDLGANAEEYWNLLKAFIQVKLTKLEFDEQVVLPPVDLARLEIDNMDADR